MYSDQQIQQWAERHNINIGSLTDLRCAFEDAASTTPPAAVSAEGVTNPYGVGSMAEAWRRGFNGENCIAHTGSDYDRAWREGLVARKGAAPAATVQGKVFCACGAVHEQTDGAWNMTCLPTMLAATVQGAGQAVGEDTKRLDALARSGWELSENNDPECMPDELWQVHKVSGGRNDREWTLIGQGATPRAAIDAALAANKEGQSHE